MGLCRTKRRLSQHSFPYCMQEQVRIRRRYYILAGTSEAEPEARSAFRCSRYSTQHQQSGGRYARGTNHVRFICHLVIVDSSSSWRRTRTERTRRHGPCEGICDITWRTMACSVLCVSASVMDREQNGGCNCHIGPAVSHPGARILATEVALQSFMGYNALCPL